MEIKLTVLTEIHMCRWRLEDQWHGHCLLGRFRPHTTRMEIKAVGASGWKAPQFSITGHGKLHTAWEFELKNAIHTLRGKGLPYLEEGGLSVFMEHLKPNTSIIPQ